MYGVDSNLVMNGTVIAILVMAAAMAIASAIASLTGAFSNRTRSYLYMLTLIFGSFVGAVALMGFRGIRSENEPMHFVLDMKYQPKYTAQGLSNFFSDRRAMRHSPDGTIPYDGADFFADAGRHGGALPAFLKEDKRYYLGIADPSAKEMREGVMVPKASTAKDGRWVEAYFALRIPEKAVASAGGWEALLARGQSRFQVFCAACHGASGRGGAGTEAHGILGAYGLSVAPADITASGIQSQAGGQLYNTIASGKGQMPGYGHQIPVQDRWAIVAHIRVLQYMRK